MKKFLVYIIIKFLLLFLCKIDHQELKKVPKQGPMILVGNHINFLDAPVIFSYLYPRHITSIVKQETFEKPILKFLFESWGSIPVNRGTADFTAVGTAVDILKQGDFLAIAPEGTRTNDGKLIQGRPGIVIIANKSRVPILPIVIFGQEKFSENIKKLKRTKVTIKVGKPFFLKFPTNQPDKQQYQNAVEEIMYQLALLLPENNRGIYRDLKSSTINYLNFEVNLEKLEYPGRQKIADSIG